MADKRERAVMARLDAGVVRLEDEFRGVLVLARHLREALQNEATDGIAGGTMAASRDIVEKLAKLAITIEKVAAAETRYLKAKKLREESFTPEEEREYASRFIRSLPRQVRSVWLGAEVRWHNAQAEKEGGTLMTSLPTEEQGS